MWVWCGTIVGKYYIKNLKHYSEEFNMVFEKIKAIIVEQLDIEEKDVTLETNFLEDLQADSLDVFQIISEIEDELDITIDTDQNLKTVGDLVNYIEAL